MGDCLKFLWPFQNIQTLFYNLFVTSKNKTPNSPIHKIKVLESVQKQDLKKILSKTIVNNTPLKWGFKRLSGLNAAL